MLSKVVPDSLHHERKRKALELALLEKHREALANADSKERKRLLKEIEKQIKEEMKNILKSTNHTGWLIR